MTPLFDYSTADSREFILTYLILNKEWVTLTFEDWAESTIWKHESGQKQIKRKQKACDDYLKFACLKIF